MDESSERPSPRPEMLQMSLGALYRELPVESFQSKTVTELADDQTKQTAMLEFLLPNAEVSSSLKRYIGESFSAGLASGRGRNRDVFAWESLGLEEPYLHPQGIFSKDPLVRMRIERDIYDHKRKELETYIEKRKLVPGEELDFIINQATTFLEEMGREFEEQYDEPIIPLASTH